MFLVYLGIFAAVFFWGSAFAGITLALDGYSPLSLALLRAVIASLLAAILYYFTSLKFKIQWAIRIKAALLGVVGVGLYSLALNFGEQTVSAGVAAFLVGQMPLIACVFASLFLKEKVEPRLWIGIGVSILGLLLITLAEGQKASLGPGVLCVISSAFFGAIYTCLQKSLLKQMPPICFICHALWGAALFLILLALFSSTPVFSEIKNAELKATGALIYLGCGPSILAYLGWTYALSKVNVAKAGILLYGMPIVGGIIAWVFLKERPQNLALLGMALAFMGSLVGSLKTKRIRPLAVPEELYQLTTGGIEDKIASGLPLDSKPKRVPRS